MRVGLAAAVAASVLALAPAAYGQAQWVQGPSEESTVLSCSSQQAGVPTQVKGTAAYSGKRVDRLRPPRVGKTFYVRLLAAAVGDPCMSPQKLAVELVLPTGVHLAITRRHRVDCFLITFGEFSDVRRRIPRSDGCPRGSTRGAYGRAFNRTGPLGPTWSVALGEVLELQIPVRASREMKGRTKPTAGCARLAGAPPCPRRRAGNQLQFSVHVMDGNANPFLVPHLGLTVRPRPAS